MDFFKSQFDRIQKQLSALTPSQRMLTAAMVAIMVMTLVWWGRYAGEPEMEPLLSQSISAEDLPKVEEQLDEKGIKHVMAGDKILVPADRKVEAVASLIYGHALPHGGQNGFDEMLKNINPFMSQSQTDEMWNHGKEITAGQIISNFPDVIEANVMIDPKEKARFGGGIEPSAIVTIKTHSGATTNISKRLVESAADVVQGALATLPRKKIKVVVNGMPCHLRTEDADGMDAGDQLEHKQQAEAYVIASIEKIVAVIPNVAISATVTLNTTLVSQHQQTYGTILQKEAEIETKATETASSPSGGGESGVTANTGLSANPSTPPAAGPTNTTEDNKTKMENFAPTTITDRRTPSGDFKPATAVVWLPRSYYFGMFGKRYPAIKDPTEAQMKPMIAEQLESIRNAVHGSTGLALQDIVVDTYFDLTPAAAVPTTASASMSMALLTGGHIRDAVVGVLALVSLFMVSMMVKKGAPAALAVPVTVHAGAAPVIEVGSELAGEVGTGNTTLDGMELDEDAIHSQQMLEQVSNLVKESPDSAASLVKRWLNRA